MLTSLKTQSQNTIQLTSEQMEDLHNLLYQLNWLNDSMISDKANSIMSALLLSMDPANKDQICEAIETISRINLSASLIKQVIEVFDNKEGE